jgi:predicted  nucleic acid-binding Zn-ribbon protein
MDPSERKKLSQTMHVLKANVETASNRHDAAQKALLEAKDHAQKIQKVQQQTQRSLTATTSSIRKKKASALERSVGLSRSRSRISDTAEAERASDRVKDVISSLYRVSALRRGQLQSKRYGAALLDDISGLPVAVKRSLKLRTGLRRQTIMLRPNLEDTLGKLKKSVENVPLEESYSAADAPGDVILRAEQLFLLAAHPVFESKNVAPVPPVQKNRTSLPWAEPGSHIDLSVPKDIVASSSLLPVAPAYSLLQQNICENLSSQGRQMATNFRPSQVAGGLQQSLTVLGQLTSTAPIVGQGKQPVASLLFNHFHASHHIPPLFVPVPLLSSQTVLPLSKTRYLPQRLK